MNTDNDLIEEEVNVRASMLSRFNLKDDYIWMKESQVRSAASESKESQIYFYFSLPKYINIEYL